MIHEPMTSSPHAMPAHSECDAILVDGGTVHVRPIGSNDRTSTSRPCENLRAYVTTRALSNHPATSMRSASRWK